jgi:hypothetical protein
MVLTPVAAAAAKLPTTGVAQNSTTTSTNQGTVAVPSHPGHLKALLMVYFNGCAYY